MNIKKTVVIGGLVAFTGLALYSVKRRKKKTDVYVVEDYIIGSIVDAQDVLKTLQEYATKYGNVSVADYYDLLGEQSNYKDNAYGWDASSLKKVKIRRLYQGYRIQLPPVEVI